MEHIPFLRLRGRLRVAAAVLLTPLLAQSALAQWRRFNPVESIARQANGVVLTLGTGRLRLEVCSPAIIHVVYTPTRAFPHFYKAGILRTACGAAPWKLSQDARSVTVGTAKLQVVVNRATGAIDYRDASGKLLIQNRSWTMQPAVVNGEKTWHAQSYFSVSGVPQGFYGLGQH